MDKSIFTNKAQVPTNEDLEMALGPVYPLWKYMVGEVHRQFPAASDEWNFPGEKYGWSFRMKDKKRAIVYLLPRKEFFKAAFVFGHKATEEIMNSFVAGDIKTELMNARSYAEGRGIRLDVTEEAQLHDMKELIRIKLAY